MTVAIEWYMQMRGEPVKLARVKKPKRVLKHVLSEAEIALFIASAKDVRTRALFSVLAYSGARNEEICKMTMEAVDIGSNTIHISGKGAKDRKACISGACMEALVAHMQERRAAGAKDGDPLFVTERRGFPMEQQDIRKLIRVYAAKAKIKKHVHPHLFRHSLATNLLKRGASLLMIRDQLGHEFLQSTLAYLHVTIEDLKSDYRRHTPCYM